MLAKKLSDEAGESKSAQGEDPRFTRSPPHVRSPLTVTQPAKKLHEHQPLANHPSLMLGSHFGKHQPLSMQNSSPLPVEYQQGKQQPNSHRKLTRQLSLQGAFDPRVAAQQKQQLQREQQKMQEYMQRQALQQAQFNQSSYLASQRRFSHTGYPMNQVPNDGSRFGQQVHQYPDNRTRVTSQQSYQPREHFQHRRQYLAAQEHAALSRIQSAPDAQPSRQADKSHRKIGHMMRQNSSSDTQLHLLGDLDQNITDYSLFPGLDGQIQTDSLQRSEVAGSNEQLSREFRTEKSTPYPSHQYRSQHQFGETRWTFDPVFGVDHGALLPKEGIDAFESDYPSSELHHRGPDPWSDSENPFYQSQPASQMRLHGYMSHHQDQFRQPPPSQQPSPPRRQEVGQKRSLARTESTGFAVHQPVEHASLSVPSFSMHDQGFGNAGAIGQEQQTNAGAMSNFGYSQFDMGMNAPQKMPSVSNLSSGPGATAVADDAPIHPSDKRYNLYYHLCGLFAEHKVRAVMNQHPEETNPQELCAYIIGAK